MPRTTKKKLVDREIIYQTGKVPEGFKLFQDDHPLEVMDVKRGTIILEDKDGKSIEKPVLKVTGVFQRANEKNANGRIYPKEVLEAAVKSIQPAVKSRRVMGEFDHPPDAKIHMERVSHLITNLWMDKDVVYGEAEVIDDPRMPCGGMLACLLERKVQVGVSSRGVGDMDLVVKEGEEAYEVQDGYSIVTFDAVAEPSVTDTQLKIMKESLNRRRRDPKLLREMHERVLLREVNRYLLS
jgi:hypothetical protein